LDEIQDCFNIRDDIELLCPSQFQIVDCPTRDCIAIHKHLMDMGFHHFFFAIFFSHSIFPLLDLPQMGGPIWLGHFCYKCYGLGGIAFSKYISIHLPSRKGRK